jgi:LPXTG-motif cell wall-anchored protein
MTGVKVPIGVATGAGLAGHPLPYTGTALGVYAAAGALMLGAGIALRLIGRTHKR